MTESDEMITLRIEAALAINRKSLVLQILACTPCTKVHFGQLEEMQNIHSNIGK